jgi:hypothetical protein
MSTLLKTEISPKSGNIITPRGRMWFCAIAERFKDKKKPDDKGQYVVTLVVPPNADLMLLKQKIKEKAEEKWSGKIPGNLKLPIRSCAEVFDKHGDPKYPAELAGYFQITANTYKQQPNVMDAKGNLISSLSADETEEDFKARMQTECYSGRWARISVSPATYETDGNRGVKLYLQNVQVLDHDEVLGGRAARAEDDFIPVATATATGGSADSVFD